MIGYLDSSVFLRVLLNQDGKLPEFSELKRPVASKLLKVECLRTLDRCKTLGELTENEFLTAVEEFYDGLNSVELIEISDSILDRASGGFPLNLGTLDAIHLASALGWREKEGFPLIMLTHDQTLGRAAKSLGFTVFGCN
jgi:predicted nucleic acid-binding protein